MWSIIYSFLIHHIMLPSFTPLAAYESQILYRDIHSFLRYSVLYCLNYAIYIPESSLCNRYNLYMTYLLCSLNGDARICVHFS